MGKMVVAGRNLDAGHVLTELDFEYRSAGQGSPPSERHLLVGKVLARGIEAFHPILENDLAS
jgi:sialic acid synthase SpsE